MTTVSGPDDHPAEPPRQYYVPPPDELPQPQPPQTQPPQSAPPQAPARLATAPRAHEAPPRPHDPAPRRSARARRAPGSRLARALRPKWRWLFLYLPLVLVLAVLATLGWAWFRFDSLYRVDLGDALAAPSGGAVNYLLVGSDSRQGVTEQTPNAGVIGPGVSGRRADTIIVLRVGKGTATMMSIPRDLWVTNVKTGRAGRINAAYNDSPANLVRTVTTNLGIPIHHYLEVDFISFSGMVDAMGGVTIPFEHPALDHHSGLNIIGTGPVRLDGTQALAYVRSRHYVEIIGGKEVADPTADLGRQQRQQTFIRTVLQEVGDTRNPWTLMRIVGAAADGTRVDDTFGLGDAVSLARNLAGVEPESVVLPTKGARKGRASVLVLQSAAAAPVLATFDGAPNTPK